jgi:uncharacterized protein (TIGR02246 family)
MRLLCVALALVLVAWTPAAAQDQPLNSELMALMADFLDAVTAGDAERVSALYADDTVVMPQIEDAILGRAGIQARFTRQIAQGMTNLRIIPVAATVDDDHGFVVANYLIDVPDGGGGLFTVEARAITVFRRVDGSWRIVFDMLNTGAPPVQ